MVIDVRVDTEEEADEVYDIISDLYDKTKATIQMWVGDNMLWWKQRDDTEDEESEF